MEVPRQSTEWDLNPGKKGAASPGIDSNLPSKNRFRDCSPRSYGCP
jgi:hypothetical protein